MSYNDLQCIDECKTCTQCKVEYPATEDYFQKVAGYKNGLRSICRACENIKNKMYYAAHIEEKHKYYKDYRLQNLEQTKSTKKKFNSSLKGKFAEYKSNAKRKKRIFELTLTEFESIVISECFYCGATAFLYNGIDRIDNSQGYTLENSVSCCAQCNWSKRHLTKDQYIYQCLAVCKHNNLI